MKYALFPGCTVLGRSRNYEMATRAVARCLDIELIDDDEFECCGFPVKSISYNTYHDLAARNIFVAESKGLDICTLCSACTGTLTEINKHLNDKFEEKARTLARLKKAGMEYRIGNNIKVKHFVRILYEDIGVEKIKRLVKKPMDKLVFAAHYGCHYFKPSEIYDQFEDPENPRTLDELILATGAHIVNYTEKLRCCGAGVMAMNEDVAYILTHAKLDDLSNYQIDGMVLMCPFCSVMYDDNQRKIEQKFQKRYNLPVLFYPQLLGLALGLEPKVLGLQMNRVSTKVLLEKIK